MTFTVLLPRKVSLNKIYSGVHWSKRNTLASEFHLAVLVSQPKPYKGPFPCHIEYHFRLKGKKLDSSNLGYMAKLIEDGLVHSKVLPDDSPDYVAATTLITDKGTDTVDITITHANITTK